MKETGKDTAFKNLQGFVSCKEHKIYRKIPSGHVGNIQKIMESGLYKKLLDKKYIVPFEEADTDDEKSGKIFASPSPFYYSYAYEWAFSQLKDAALLLLSSQKLALEHGMTINSAKCENIQFYGGKPLIFDIFIFEEYNDKKNNDFYEEFCRMFLAPLAIMSYTDVRLGQLLKTYIKGIPLDLTCHILPITANLNMGLVTHIFKHAKRIKEKELAAEKNTVQSKKQQSLQTKENLKSLADCIKSLSFPDSKTEWGNFYKHTSYSDKAFFAKKEIITNYLDKVHPELVYDLGSNRGKFSRIASNKKINTVAFDIDAVAVEKNYLHAKKAKETHILPLFQDLTNPSSDMGFMNAQKTGFMKRTRPDLTMALAILPHLVLKNGLKFEEVAKFLRTLSAYLIIEFVPAEDKKVKQIISALEEEFPDYTKERFARVFEKFFDILDEHSVADTKRTIYLMKVKE